jgi:hypothetical protein
MKLTIRICFLKVQHSAIPTLFPSLTGHGHNYILYLCGSSSAFGAFCFTWLILKMVHINANIELCLISNLHMFICVSLVFSWLWFQLLQRIFNAMGRSWAHKKASLLTLPLNGVMGRTCCVSKLEATYDPLHNLPTINSISLQMHNKCHLTIINFKSKKCP